MLYAKLHNDLMLSPPSGYYVHHTVMTFDELMAMITIRVI